jgi:6-pyruvoyltetrahydropterin/6-carboxytetrahydropterin synthase
MIVHLTRRYAFSASHRLHSTQLSDEANREVYGKCNHPFGHGHNYEVEVTVGGKVDEQTGRVVDLEDLDRLVQKTVREPFEHRNLNEEVEEFKTLVPTTENLAVVVEQRLQHAWKETFPGMEPRLKRVRIYETARNIFEI